jgi:peptide/nickel transport system permease protein
MIRYLLQRLLLFAPTLLVVLVLVFGLSQLVPGDPVQEANADEFEQRSISEADLLRMYHRRAARMGLDKPAFFFSIQPAAYPDTLYKIPFRQRRDLMLKVLRQNGNWPAVQAYFGQISDLKKTLQAIPKSWNSEARSSLGQIVGEIQFTSDLQIASLHLAKMPPLLAQDSVLRKYTAQGFAALKKAHQFLLEHPQQSKLYWPRLVWQGLDNQFTHTFRAYLQGDLGRSFNDGKPVSAKIWRALRWTLLLNAFALPIAYALAIFLGVRMALHKNSHFDQRWSTFLFGLYSMPSFWVALLLLVLFSNPAWGMNFIRITGMMDLDENTSWSRWLTVTTRQMVVPIVCLVYPALATLTRQMRGAMIVALNQDYVRTARAKGLPEKEVIWRHAFPNAVFPLLTAFGALLPELVTSSILLENIFNLPGIGNQLLTAMGTQDWPLVFGIVLLGALLSIVGLLLVDLMYAWLDPRVRLGRSKNVVL